MIPQPTQRSKPDSPHQIAVQTTYITFIVTDAISHATTVRVGQLIGSRDVTRVQAGYVGLGIGAFFMGLMALFFWKIPTAIVSLYLDTKKPENYEVLQASISLLYVAAVFQVFDGIQVIAAGALRGLNDTYVAMLIGLFAYWCIGLSSGYVMGICLKLSGVGIWWGLALGLASAAGILTWRFHSLMTQLCYQNKRS